MATGDADILKTHLDKLFDTHDAAVIEIDGEAVGLFKNSGAFYLTDPSPEEGEEVRVVRALAVGALTEKMEGDEVKLHGIKVVSIGPEMTNEEVMKEKDAIMSRVEVPKSFVPAEDGSAVLSGNLRVDNLQPEVGLRPETKFLPT